MLVRFSVQQRVVVESRASLDRLELDREDAVREVLVQAAVLGTGRWRLAGFHDDVLISDNGRNVRADPRLDIPDVRAGRHEETDRSASGVRVVGTTKRFRAEMDKEFGISSNFTEAGERMMNALETFVNAFEDDSIDDTAAEAEIRNFILQGGFSLFDAPYVPDMVVLSDDPDKGYEAVNSGLY